jgi:hypothetical protein
MTNKQFIQSNIDDQSATEILPARRVYLFRDLPPDVQAKLLRMQNTDGDFLRLSNGVTGAKVILLILLSLGFAFFLAAFEFSLFDLRIILIISGGAFVFTLWFFYLVWGIFKTIASPIKNRIYLTPTEVIETADGTIRYRELKDAAEISVNRYWNDNGRRSSLDIKFDDGDIYQYRLDAIRNSVQFSETKKWQEQAAIWRDAAISASKRGDTAYFNSRDVFRKSLIANKPVLKRESRGILLKITLALFVASVLVYFLLK